MKKSIRVIGEVNIVNNYKVPMFYYGIESFQLETWQRDLNKVHEFLNVLADYITRVGYKLEQGYKGDKSVSYFIILLNELVSIYEEFRSDKNSDSEKICLFSEAYGRNKEFLREMCNYMPDYDL
ncbi:hypothetical protein RF11_14052 [Thelohanellus kitauei]|uniref:Uncharacterized protein n=1 Tax=Thelohanellus kitauei TaxID=669202 RepID=A0A0C2N277_THEKT|nr:hypothetical protein RF11_14052 [Thelohanellus kitauei]